METIQSFLEGKLRLALGTSDGTNGEPGISPKVTPATDTQFGDYQTNAAMLIAKRERKNPRAVAQQILDRLDVADLCEAPDIAGAGFINFRLKPAPLAAWFSRLAADEKLGVPAPEIPRKIIVDFSSPNVAKPMHVGHIRSTILGDALARIAEFIGHEVVRDNHIGDWGTQFGMLLVGWKSVLNREALAADPLGEMERIYKLISARCKEDPATLEEARRELVKLQAGDGENLALWREMIDLSQKQFDEIYGRLDVKFDVSLGESFYNPWLKETARQLLERGIARESEGALCVFSDGTLPEKEDPFLIQRDGEWGPMPALVQKTDGGSNYTTTDLATLEYRLNKWAPDEIIYVTDGRQQLHFRQLFAIFRRWHPELSAKVRLAHVWFGSILGEDGKPFKTRSGETIKLAGLLDEAVERARKILVEKNPSLPESELDGISEIIGIGAVKYADLSPNRQSDYVFSWDKMLALQGNTAPYLQYSYVRIRSIFRKGEVDETSLDRSTITFVAPAEMALAIKLCQFGEILPQVLEDFRQNSLANYLYELASTFHSFFEACPVLKAEEPARSTRLALCELTARVLKQGLALLGIGVPEKM
jgi:arginyl-tRNA synthetase